MRLSMLILTQAAVGVFVGVSFVVHAVLYLAAGRLFSCRHVLFRLFPFAFPILLAVVSILAPLVLPFPC